MPTITLKRSAVSLAVMVGLLAAAAPANAAEPGDTTGAARKSASLVMLAADGPATARYYLESAWPAKIEIGGLRAGSAEVLNET